MHLLLILINYLYTEPQEYELVLKAGKYKFECYGGQGGEGYDDKVIHSQGGKGAYVYGELSIRGKGTTFIVNVGGKGSSGPDGPNLGGFNGGGSGGEDTGIADKKEASGGGGGASDIRSSSDIYDRIMVAAGGSGGAGYANGAPGGTLNGIKIGCNKCNKLNYKCESYPEYESDLTTQTKGAPELGVGGDGKSARTVPGSGGGGGWRGGVSSGESSGGTDCYHKSIAHSGSSYVSGYPGCQPSSVNGYLFENSGMAAGQNEGNGKVNVTTLYECKENCASCSSSDNCFECIEPFKLFDNNCYDVCPDGTRESGTICELCKDSNCLKCPSSADLCDVCKNSFFLLNENDVTSCVEKCPDGKIGIDGKCIDCNQKCSTCSLSVDYCDSCQNNNFLYNGDCYSECNVLNDESNGDYYGKDNINKKCLKCSDNNCIDCSSDYEKCNKCIDSFYVEEKTYKCVKIPSHTFTNSDHFSESASFESSNQFSNSAQFTKSNQFSNSAQFTKSNQFSNSDHFTKSNQFSSSNFFTQTDHFTSSDEFSPSKFSCLVTDKNENTMLSERCFYSGSLSNQVDIHLVRSCFENFINESNGGAIYILDSTIHFSDSEFINCVSSNGCGGAIYINNSIEMQNDIAFSNLTFRNCKATFGGAVVIISIYDLSNVSISYCKFYSNSVIKKNSNKNNDFNGGSAAFLCAKNMYIDSCDFVKNKGSSGALKIYNNFNEVKAKMKRINNLDYIQKSIVVSNCNFELNDDSKSSIYYVNGKHQSIIDIINCNFYTKRNKKNSYIDGKELDLGSSKVSIKSCSFQKVSTNFYATFIIMLSVLAVISIAIALFEKHNQNTNNDDISL